MGSAFLIFILDSAFLIEFFYTGWCCFNIGGNADRVLRMHATRV